MVSVSLEPQEALLHALLREGHDRVVDAVGRLFRQVTVGAPTKTAKAA